MKTISELKKSVSVLNRNEMKKCNGGHACLAVNGEKSHYWENGSASLMESWRAVWEAAGYEVRCTMMYA